MTKSHMKSGQGSIGKKFSTILDNLSLYFDAPIISQGETWIRVNDILIMFEEDDYSVRRNGKTITKFHSKSWATAFAVALAKGNKTMCFELMNAEKQIKKLQEDINYYNYSIIQSRKTNNIEKESNIKNRLSRTEFELNDIISTVGSCVKSLSIA